MTSSATLIVTVIIGLVTVSGIQGHRSYHYDHIDDGHEEYHRTTQYSSLRDFLFHKKEIEPVRMCGQVDLTSKELEESESTVRKWVEHKQTIQVHELETVQIPTFFHLVTNGTDGDKSDDDILKQLEVLNNGFQGTGFMFSLAGITRTVNESWYRSIEIVSRLEYEMKSTLRQGNASSLNIYLPGELVTSLGWATYPIFYKRFPLVDGVVLHTESIPGGNLENHNLGKIATHEVGHWLGLLHTFQGYRGRYRLRNGCTSRGDYVDDTPAEKSPAYRCPASRNTCQLRPGNDPINNYMDYTYDACRNELTAGQIERMQAFWNEYRS